MIKTDYHVHSTHSHDGISTMEEHVQTAIKNNIEELCFTEHYDIYEGVKNSTLKTIDVENYVQNFYELQKKYQNEITLKLGIEIGLQPDISNTIKEMVSKYNFDFIIGSSHITCKKDISKDPSFFEGLTQKEAYNKYFKEVLENIKIYNEFDVYGHIDYIVRYGGYTNKQIKYEEYQDILDNILKTIISKNKGIEINTSGYRYGLNTAHPNTEILARYKELGGEILTIGSDAHQACDLCSNFEEISKLLKKLGYTKYTTFKNREPQMRQLGLS